jgi:glucan phosphoethanolaminetransferase (alkaline phosphatase superfamily)
MSENQKRDCDSVSAEKKGCFASLCRGVWCNIFRVFRGMTGFYEINLFETCYILSTFFIMLAINYFLIAMNGFSLSYAKQWPGISCVGSVFWFLLFLLSFHFICRRNRWVLWLMTTAQFLVLFILFAVYLTTGTFFCESVLFLVYDTTWDETKGFFSAYVNFKSLVLLVLVLVSFFSAMYFAMRKHKSPGKYCRGDLRALITIAVLLLFPFVSSFRNGERNFFKTLFSSHPVHYICNQIGYFNRNMKEFISEMRDRTPLDRVRLNEGFEGEGPVGVFVVGESAIRSHHSIYGYHRNTTPNLMARKDSIILFDDAICVLPVTITALKYWLTDMTLADRHVKWTLFDVLKKAGYKVDIATNQNKSGWADSPIQMIFKTADSVTYIHEENYSDLEEDKDARIYDEALIAPFDAWINKTGSVSTPQMMVLHLFGSHEPYASRYPKDFAEHFLSDAAFTQRVNEYDSSILYTDMVLGKLLERLEKIDRPAFLVYISDHGSVCESPDLRNPQSRDNSAYEVPFFIWTNSRYREAMPDTVLRMQKRRGVPLQADRAHFGLLEMMGVSFSDDVETENFLSDRFEIKPRFIDEGSAPYVKDAE